MLYAAYELGLATVAPARVAAGLGARFWRSPFNPVADSWLARTSAAALDVFENATRRYPKPQWGIAATEVNGSAIPVSVETVLRKDFCTLLRFHRDPEALAAVGGGDDPKVLIVAPLSGHYATLLRGTVEAMLPAHDVYVTDWADARDVQVASGRFDLNDYVDYLIEFLHQIGPRAHAIAVCQPGPALLAASALLAESEDPARPASITLMGSPIDTRLSPTVPNRLSQERPYSWFENNMIYTVPPPYLGVLRRVYPGFVQLGSFLSMNSDRHLNAHYDYFQNLVKGDGDSAEKHRGFYDEYLSVLDMTEEFYLQTIRDVFQEHALPDGKFVHQGRLVRPDVITDVALMTVEGGRDDISGVGQTQAAHDLCRNLPADLKLKYVQPEVGHYGVFNGSRWRNEIQPQIAGFIRRNDLRGGRRARLKIVAA
jgi:poly(3-hydroxybutyrate) depolymerase